MFAFAYKSSTLIGGKLAPSAAPGHLAWSMGGAEYALAWIGLAIVVSAVFWGVIQFLRPVASAISMD